MNHKINKITYTILPNKQYYNRVDKKKKKLITELCITYHISSNTFDPIIFTDTDRS